MNDNFARLTQAGIIDADADWTQDDRLRLESLSSDEVATIIEIKKKLGNRFFEEHAKPRADFIF